MHSLQQTTNLQVSVLIYIQHHNAVINIPQVENDKILFSDTSFLDLKKGDLIYLKEKYNGNDLLQNSWAYGQNARTEETGKFLYECVEIIPSIWLPSQSFIETIRKAEKTSEPTQLLNKLKPLKALGQHTLEAYAVEFFIEEKKV